jgi:hypothetical protein
VRRENIFARRENSSAYRAKSLAHRDRNFAHRVQFSAHREKSSARRAKSLVDLLPNFIDRVRKEAKTGLCTRQERAADAVEAGCGGFLQGVLPDADDFPALPSELVSDAFIAGHVVLKLFIPESSVGFRPRVALGATVPETSVEK